MSLLSVVLAALLAMPWWVTKAMNSLRDELSAKIDATNARIDQQRLELTAMIDKQRVELTAQINALGKEVAGLKDDMAALRERMARIEARLPEASVPASG